MQEATEKFLKEAEERQRRDDELNKGKVGRDPALRWNPVFNPVQEEEEEPNWVVAIERQEREKAKCVAEWDTALELIKAGRFATRGSLAKHFGKPRHWAYEVVRLSNSTRNPNQYNYTENQHVQCN